MQKDKSLSDRFAQFGSEPSDQVWTKIEDELTSRKRKRFLLLLWIGIPVLMSLSLLSYMIAGSHSENSIAVIDHSTLKTNDSKEIRSDKDKVSTISDLNKGQNIDETVSEKLKLKPRSNSKNNEKLKSGNELISSSTVRGMSNNSIKESEGTVSKDSITKEDGVEQIEKKTISLPENTSTEVRINSIENRIEKEVLNRVKLFEKINAQKRWSIGLYLGTGYDFKGERETITESYTDVTASPSTNQNITEQLERINSRINVQFLVSYSLSSRLTLSTGIGYTQLSKRLSINDGTITTLSTQGNLINNPINLNFNYINRTRFRAYFGGGYTNSMFYSANKKGINYLGSFQVQSGVQFNLSNSLSLDIQPALQRFVIDKSDMKLKGRMMIGGAVGLTYGFGR